MADILQTAFWNASSWKKKIISLIKISLKFVPGGPIDKWSMVKEMAWCGIDDKPLPELMMT